MQRLFPSIAGLFSLLFCLSASAQIDVLSYHFELELTDRSDAINGKAIITVLFKTDASRVSFDLASVEEDKGMQAFDVKEDSLDARWDHHNDRLLIDLPKPARAGESHVFTISYIGTPKDGLIISRNRYGDRTFFADNWPTRAHNWIPCNDRPDDKAIFEFSVTAPDHYRIVANGIKTEETAVGGHRLRTGWKESTPLSPYNMVIGAAAFATKQFDDSPKDLPITAWVYPQDSAKGFYDYAPAPSIVGYFSRYIGPFPYRKLANVQSKTRFGGMENASAIFYAEQSVTGDRKWEEVLAHEIAHQWFGDMATESSFAHLWLSEGFATYLADLYMGSRYGRDSLVSRLREERDQAVGFALTSNHPVVDSASDYMSLLNANSYQKGAWILHMIHEQVGDLLFQVILRAYYEQYKGRNADTRDFEHVVEAYTHEDWTSFFDQWLYRPGVPVLQMTSEVKKGQVYVTIRQLQPELYTLSIDLGIFLKGDTDLKVLTVKDRVTTWPVNAPPGTQFVLDPTMRLLFKEKK